MLEKVTACLRKIGRLRLKARSVWLFRCIVFLGIAPYVLAIAAWLWSMIFNQHEPWMIPMIDSCLRISEKIFAPAAVTAALNLVPKIQDDDGDGVPDVDQKPINTADRQNKEPDNREEANE